MVQEIAQEIIRSARKKGTQDIYFVPKLDAYELHMRVGDERCKIGSYDFEKFAAVISHFKFVAGMNVGEKRRSQLGSCDYAYDQKMASLRLSTVGDYRGMRVWLSVCCTMRSRTCIFGFRILKN